MTRASGGGLARIRSRLGDGRRICTFMSATTPVNSVDWRGTDPTNAECIAMERAERYACEDACTFLREFSLQPHLWR